jgi:hypothetical protein
MGEVERTKRPGGQPVSAGKTAQTVENITYRRRDLEAELERVEAQRVCIAGEEEDAHRESRNRCAWHD